MPTFDANTLPSSTGFDLGSAAQRWDAFLQQLNVSAAATFSGTTSFTAAITAGLFNGLRIVDGAQFTTIQAAVDDLSTGGGIVYVPPGAYTLTAEVDLANPNIIIIGGGQDATNGTRITQTTYGLSGFEIRADGCQIFNLRLINNQGQATISGSYDGEPARNRAAGVYIANASHTLVQNVSVISFIQGVRNRGNTDDSTFEENNRVHNCYFKSVSQGVLIQGQRSAVLTGLIGEDILDTQSAPSHLIYFTQGGASFQQQACVVADCTDRDNAGGANYKFVNCQNFTVSNVNGKDGESCFDMGQFDDSVVMGGTFRNMQPLTNRGLVNITGCSDTFMIGVRMQTADDFDEGGFRFHDVASNDFEVRDCYIGTDHSSGSSKKMFRVLVGNRIRCINCTFEQLDADKTVVSFEGGTDHVLINPILKGGTRLLNIDSGVTNVRVKINRDLLFTTPTANLIADSGTGTIISFESGEYITLDDTGTPSVIAGRIFTTGGTTAITAFDDGFKVQEIKIISSHSVTITDGPALNLAGAANYSMTADDTLTLAFNGTNWYELGRSVN